MTLELDKQAVRERAAAARDGLDPVCREAAGAALVRMFEDHVRMTDGSAVAAFWPSKGEIDVRPLLNALYEAGHICGLPIVAGKGRPLTFRQWSPDIVLQPGRFDIPVPPAGSPTVDPDALLVPLLAFDRAGQRLGWGAGFYDRTLAQMRARRTVLAVGIAFAAQEVDFVPHGPRDQRLDWVITECEAIRIEDMG